MNGAGHQYLNVVGHNLFADDFVRSHTLEDGGLPARGVEKRIEFGISVLVIHKSFQRSFEVARTPRLGQKLVCLIIAARGIGLEVDQQAEFFCGGAIFCHSYVRFTPVNGDGIVSDFSNLTDRPGRDANAIFVIVSYGRYHWLVQEKVKINKPFQVPAIYIVTVSLPNGQVNAQCVLQVCRVDKKHVLVFSDRRNSTDKKIFLG